VPRVGKKVRPTGDRHYVDLAGDRDLIHRATNQQARNIYIHNVDFELPRLITVSRWAKDSISASGLSPD